MSHSNDSPARKLKYIDPASFTPQFEWEKSRAGSAGSEAVVCERVPLDSIAQKFGTPTYVYSGAAIEGAYQELHKGLGALPHTLCFAVKSNGNLSLLQHLAKLRSGFDIVAGGELHHLQLIGGRGPRIVCSGAGKYRRDNYHAESSSTGVGAARCVCRGVAGQANRSALPGCWRRARRALFGSEASDTHGVRATSFKNGAQAWRASLARAGALDHCSCRCALDARCLHENESGQDVCSGGRGDERLDAASALRRHPSHPQSCSQC